jgi:hypothetical protein
VSGDEQTVLVLEPVEVVVGQGARGDQVDLDLVDDEWLALGAVRVGQNLDGVGFGLDRDEIDVDSGPVASASSADPHRHGEAADECHRWQSLCGEHGPGHVEQRGL